MPATHLNYKPVFLTLRIQYFSQGKYILEHLPLLLYPAEKSQSDIPDKKAEKLIFISARVLEGRHVLTADLSVSETNGRTT